MLDENAFARYRSDSKVDSGKLVIVRELQIKPHASASSKAELESFWRLVREDQRRRFILRRIKPINLTEWIQSVPPDRANKYAARAYQQREYQAARQLLERATRANPNDPDAWNKLGRTLVALGRSEEGQNAYQKQIAVNPKSSYAYTSLGVLQGGEGYWEMAIESFRKQIQIHPADGPATADLPRALLQVGRWAEAEAAAAKALSVTAGKCAATSHPGNRPSLSGESHIRATGNGLCASRHSHRGLTQ